MLGVRGPLGAVRIVGLCVLATLVGVPATTAAIAPTPAPAAVVLAARTPAAALVAVPLTRAAVVSWARPQRPGERDHAVVRGVRGLVPPVTRRSGHAVRTGADSGFLARHLRAGTSYSWTVFGLPASRARGGHAAVPVRLTLHGTRLAGRVTRTAPPHSPAVRYVARLVDADTGRGLAAQDVDVYRRRPGHHWLLVTSAATDAHGRVRAEDRVVPRASYQAFFGGGGHHLGSVAAATALAPGAG